jgi:hypothetical protein
MLGEYVDELSEVEIWSWEVAVYKASLRDKAVIPTQFNGVAWASRLVKKYAHC